MKHDRDFTDAEFEVVEPPRGWNGVGWPPMWREWSWLQRLVYVAVFGWCLWWIAMIAIEARAIVPLLVQR